MHLHWHPAMTGCQSPVSEQVSQVSLVPSGKTWPAIQVTRTAEPTMVNTALGSVGGAGHSSEKVKADKANITRNNRTDVILFYINLS